MEYETIPITVKMLNELRAVQKKLSVTNKGLDPNNKGLEDMIYNKQKLNTIRKQNQAPGFVQPPGRTTGRCANKQLYLDINSTQMQNLYTHIAQYLAKRADPHHQCFFFVSDIFILAYNSKKDQAEHKDLPDKGKTYWTVGLGPQRTTQLPVGSGFKIPNCKDLELLAWHGDVAHKGSAATSDTHVRMFMTFWDRKKVKEDPNIEQGNFVQFMRLEWKRVNRNIKLDVVH
jgi:hypothetical protein